MTIGIVGLGLIGGSLARAIKKYTDNRVIISDIDEAVEAKAIEDKNADGLMQDEDIFSCDIIILGLYPEGIKNWIRKFNALYEDRLKCSDKPVKAPLITDICGIKTDITTYIKSDFGSAPWSYISTHPMAGTEKTGYYNSSSELFRNASMLLIPVKNSHEELELLKGLFLKLGFGKCIVTDEENHDRIIAFTSQLAHVVSNAYVKSDSALLHHGYSAGSYKDLTRVAWLNEDMWTELFMANRKYLADEIENIITELGKYKSALDRSDADELKGLLRDGRKRKEEIDR
ncbi:MAG: prephenate dehydrogenase/arogenate dehydrogenase family protein [Eubacteriales bacterium]|nr:prephenate dehydrogenase/arogenate dehydrogenase family protein [Eubacteriales bacterium]